MSSAFPPYDLIVLGAGISGLTCAHQARKKNLRCLVLESSGQIGGVIQTFRQDNYLIESGPNTVLLNEELLTLINELNLNPRMVLSDAKIPRYIQFKNRLYEFPLSPQKLISSPLLSLTGRLRFILEPFVRAPREDTDETIYDFFKRRIGQEATERLIAPFVSGVWAGDIRQLSIGSTFTLLHTWERKHGSLFRAMLKSKKEKSNSPAVPKGLLSFDEGLSVLTKALGSELKDNLLLGVKILNVAPSGSSSEQMWSVQTSETTFTTKKIILALPAYEASKLLRPIISSAALALDAIPYSPMTVIHMGIDSQEVKNLRPGFGYLIAPSEKQDVLGCLWSSQIFSNRAPGGKILLTVFMGGALRPEIVQWPEDQAVSRAVQSITPIMGLKSRPKIISYRIIEKAIPQFIRGHDEIIRKIKNAETTHSGLHFAANYLSGVSVGDVVKYATKLLEIF